MHVLLFGELILSALFSMRIRASKGAFYKLREHFVQFADFNLFKYPLTLESYAENAAWKERLLTSIRTEPLKS